MHISITWLYGIDNPESTSLSIIFLSSEFLHVLRSPTYGVLYGVASILRNVQLYCKSCATVSEALVTLLLSVITLILYHLRTIDTRQRSELGTDGFLESYHPMHVYAQPY